MVTVHDLTALPSRCTVQAPHSPTPHPNLVPVRARSSRKYHMSGISGSPSKLLSFWFTFSFIWYSSFESQVFLRVLPCLSALEATVPAGSGETNAGFAKLRRNCTPLAARRELRQQCFCARCVEKALEP